jgi:hypothetical protein
MVIVLFIVSVSCLLTLNPYAFSSVSSPLLSVATEGISSVGPPWIPSPADCSTFQIPGVCALGIFTSPSFFDPFHVKNPHAVPLRPDGRGFMRVTVQNESAAPRSSHRARAKRLPTPYAGCIFASSNTGGESGMNEWG